jgi:hypothetical protein
LLRCFKERKLTRRSVRELESDLFFEFLAKARTKGGTVLDDWDVLFLMQHYGVPMRLLDWTEVLFVALYFAVHYRQDNEISQVFVMNPYRWNQHRGYGRDLYWPRYFGWDPKAKDYYEFGVILVDQKYIDWKYPCALYPPQRDARLSAQRGFFTIHGDDMRPLDAISPRLIGAIDLSSNAATEIEAELQYSGVNEYSLFPDLEGLARYLKIKNSIE